MFKYSQRINFLIFAVFTIILYFPVLVSNFVGDIDTYLVSELKDILSLSEYISAWRDSKIHDIQPIRDISLLFDREMTQLTGISSYQYTSLFIWLITTFIIYKTVLAISTLSSLNTSLLFLLFISHPLYVKSVSYIGLRKHLLAFLFGALFIKTILVESKSRFSKFHLALFHTLSLLSQPINIFLPIWSTYYSKYIMNKSYKETLKTFAIPILLSLFLGVFNLWWYLDVSQVDSGVSKYMPGNSIADRVLAIGRYFSFFFIPINFSIFYGKESILCLLGIFIGPSYFYLVYKYVNKEKFYSFLLLFLFSIAPVVIQMFETFVSDSYFLMGSYCLFLTLFYTLKKLSTQKGFTIFLGIIVAILTTQSFSLIKQITNKDTHIEAAYFNDKNCVNLYYYVNHLFNNRNFKEGAERGTELIYRKCIWTAKKYHHEFIRTLSNIHLFTDLKPEIKERKLKEFSKVSYYNKLNLALYYFTAKRFDDFLTITNEGIKNRVTVDKEDIIVQEISRECDEINHPYCKNFKTLLRN